MMIRCYVLHRGAWPIGTSRIPSPLKPGETVEIDVETLPVVDGERVFPLSLCPVDHPSLEARKRWAKSSLGATPPTRSEAAGKPDTDRAIAHSPVKVAA